jgi:hypothetical protein
VEFMQGQTVRVAIFLLGLERLQLCGFRQMALTSCFLPAPFVNHCYIPFAILRILSFPAGHAFEVGKQCPLCNYDGGASCMTSTMLRRHHSFAPQTFNPNSSSNVPTARLHTSCPDRHPHGVAVGMHCVISSSDLPPV